jgi:hypothetical protein
VPAPNAAKDRTDRLNRCRLAWLCLAVSILITAKLIDWRNRCSPDRRFIR